MIQVVTKHYAHAVAGHLLCVPQPRAPAGGKTFWAAQTIQTVAISKIYPTKTPRGGNRAVSSPRLFPFYSTPFLYPADVTS